MSETTNNAFKKWYEKGKDKLSEKRKQRYQTDPEYRAKYLARAAKRRAEFPPPSRAGQPRIREVGGKPQEVFSIGETSQMIGIGPQTIRQWEAAGTIPPPSVEGVHRLYTNTQIKQLKELAQLSHEHRYDRAGRDTIIAAASTRIWHGWNQDE